MQGELPAGFAQESTDLIKSNDSQSVCSMACPILSPPMPAADFVSAVGLKRHTECPTACWLGWSTMCLGLGVPQICRKAVSCQSSRLSSSKYCGEKFWDMGPVKGTNLQRVLQKM